MHSEVNGTEFIIPSCWRKAEERTPASLQVPPSHKDALLMQPARISAGALLTASERPGPAHPPQTTSISPFSCYFPPKPGLPFFSLPGRGHGRSSTEERWSCGPRASRPPRRSEGSAARWRGRCGGDEASSTRRLTFCRALTLSSPKRPLTPW